MIGWSIPALLLLLPLVAMQFTDEVNWTVGDFLFASLMMGGVGLALELTVSKSRNWSYRAGVGSALAATFLIIWANGAVGMIGSEDNPYNLLFFGVILVALIGSVAASFRPAAMALAMTAAAIAHAAVALGGLTADLLGGVLSMGFAGLWLLAAALFWNAAREQTAAGATRQS